MRHGQVTAANTRGLECWLLLSPSLRVLEPSLRLIAVAHRRPRRKVTLFRLSDLKVDDLPEVLDFCHVVGRSHRSIESPEKKRRNKTTRKSTAIVKPPVYGALSNLHSSRISTWSYVRRSADGPHQKLVFVYLSLYTRHITA